jgi:hypothetical protein
MFHAVIEYGFSEMLDMTYKGHIKNGSVVLDEPVALPDGAEVTVDLVPAQRPVPLAELLKDVIGKATGLPPVRPMREYRGFLCGMDTTIDREDEDRF